MLSVEQMRVEIDGVRIVHDVDMAVGAGEWVTVIGPNGAGKSTMLRAIGGALRYHGTIRMNGVDVAQLPKRRRARQVAMVAQHPTVPPSMLVFDYVLLGRTPYIPPLGRESADDLSMVENTLAQLSLARFAGRPLSTLSGGERQRVFLARALAQGAPLLLLDEPTSALDIGHQQEVLELVDEQRHSRGLTVLATMHDLSLAGEYADRLVLLADGRVAVEGKPTEVLTEEHLASHYQAKVRVIEGEFGPIVIPARLRA